MPAYIVPLVLISTVMVFGLFLWNARRSAEEQLQTKLEKPIDIQRAVLAKSPWNVAYQRLKRILSARLTDPDVLAGADYEEGDRLVAEVAKRTRSEPPGSLR